jgi:hypothetical protein
MQALSCLAVRRDCLLRQLKVRLLADSLHLLFEILLRFGALFAVESFLST